MKIKDRVILGLLAGWAANLTKRGIMKATRYLQWAEIDGPEKAAGMLLPAHKITTPRGRIVGNICDFTMAGIIGVISVYALSVTGKDHAVVKGALIGEKAWTFAYGVLGGPAGLSNVYPVSTKTILSQCAAHISYGMTTAYLITKFGEEALFTGKMPISASRLENESFPQEDLNQEQRGYDEQYFC